MPENAIIPDTIIPDGVIPAEEAVPETAKERFERERLSRRQALKKFGMTSAMATFALFSVDDLARMVGKAMQQRAADNKVVEQVAKEFQQAGIALAGMPGDLPYPYNCTACITHYYDVTAPYVDQYTACVAAEISPSTPTHTSVPVAGAESDCASLICPKYNDALYEVTNCLANQGCPGMNINITPRMCQSTALP